MDTKISRLLNIRNILAAAAVILAAVPVLLSWHLKNSAVLEYRRLNRQLTGDVSGKGFVPSGGNIFRLQREYERLIGKKNKLWAVLQKKAFSLTPIAPLQFKDRMLDIQVKLGQLAGIQGCILCGDIGFNEYAAGGIPRQEEVTLLCKQLTVINEVLNVFLKHKVFEVKSVERLPGVYYGEGRLYKEILFRIKAKCTVENILGILADLVNLPHIVVVRSLKIERTDKGNMDVDIVTGAVEFFTQQAGGEINKKL